MAKRKSKKQSKSLINLISKIIVIVLAILTICTVFMPVISRKTAALGGSFETTYSIYGKDVFTGLFNNKISFDYSEGANKLIEMKEVDGVGFATTFFMILYMVLLAVSVAVIVFNVLSLIGMKFKLINLVLSFAVVAVAILTFIFAIVTASKLGSLDLGVVVETKGVISVGIYMLIATLVMGGMYAFDVKTSK